jgi:hypothetical protein
MPGLPPNPGLEIMDCFRPEQIVPWRRPAMDRPDSRGLPALHRELPVEPIPGWLGWSDLNGVGPETILRDEALMLKDLEEALPGRKGKYGLR